jgi:putative exosortase-associated protein (TIGR04073 family)
MTRRRIRSDRRQEEKRMTIRIRKQLIAGALFAALALPLGATADTAGDKAVRGFAGMALPFLEIPGNILHTSRVEGAAQGWTEGLVRGLGMTLIRPAVGFYELVTAPLPAPSAYQPILRPEFPWSYFEDDYRGQSTLAQR